MMKKLKALHVLDGRSSDRDSNQSPLEYKQSARCQVITVWTGKLH